MSAIYYKATRLDGTAFHDRKVKYEVGKTVRPVPHHGPRRVCGPGLLHAADVPGETLIGGSWPCRLFEVTGKPYAGFDAGHRHKGGFRQLKVVREIDAHHALGPNGRYVAGIIERSRAMTYDEALQLAAARAAAGAAAWAAAWAAAGVSCRDLITAEQLEVLYGPWRSVFGDPEGMS